MSLIVESPEIHAGLLIGADVVSFWSFFKISSANHSFQGAFCENDPTKSRFPLARNLFGIFKVKTQISKGKSVPSLKGATN